MACDDYCCMLCGLNRQTAPTSASNSANICNVKNAEPHMKPRQNKLSQLQTDDMQVDCMQVCNGDCVQQEHFTKVTEMVAD